MDDRDLRNKDEGMKLYRSKEQENKRMEPSGSGSGSKIVFKFKTREEEPQADPRFSVRSKDFLTALALVDVLSSTDEEIIAALKENVEEETLEELSELSMDEIIQAIKDNFNAEYEKLLDIKEIPRPSIVLSKCYIDGCDVHAIDGFGNILQHYGIGSSVPEEVETGRKAYYKHLNCRCVEVYGDRCMVILPDGTSIKEDN